MKKSLIIALLFGIFGLISNQSFAQKRSKSSKTYKIYKPKTEPVRGYVKKNGTYVAPYRRSRKS